MGREKNEKDKEVDMQSVVIKDLMGIVADERRRERHPMYLRTVLKEYLQVFILNFIYTHPRYSKKIIFE